MLITLLETLGNTANCKTKYTLISINKHFLDKKKKTTNKNESMNNKYLDKRTEVNLKGINRCEQKF